MNQEKYIGMDVHQATISVAVMESSGKLIMECILETKAATILEFIDGLRGTLSVTFEEGTSATWLHDLLKPHVSHLVVCDPRRNALSMGCGEICEIPATLKRAHTRENRMDGVVFFGLRSRTSLELCPVTGRPDGTAGKERASQGKERIRQRWYAGPPIFRPVTVSSVKRHHWDCVAFGGPQRSRQATIDGRA